MKNRRTYLKGLLAFLAFAGVMAIAQASLGATVYAYFKDNSGSDIKGGNQTAGQEGSVIVREVSHNVHIPTDPHTGALTGVRMHAPLTIIKDFDSSTPYLLKGLIEGQTFKQVKIVFEMRDSARRIGPGYIILLENVKVSSVTAHRDQGSTLNLEDVSLVYGKITWTWVDGNIEYMDSWVTKN